jgi:hypothetical protein
MEIGTRRTGSPQSAYTKTIITQNYNLSICKYYSLPPPARGMVVSARWDCSLRQGIPGILTAVA